MNDWEKAAADIRALRPELRFFGAHHYHTITTDTKLSCGCAVGQLLAASTVRTTDCVHEKLGLRVTTVEALYRINDRFRSGEQTEAACVARYNHVLAECERRSKTR